MNNLSPELTKPKHREQVEGWAVKLTKKSDSVSEFVGNSKTKMPTIFADDKNMMLATANAIYRYGPGGTEIEPVRVKVTVEEQ